MFDCSSRLRVAPQAAKSLQERFLTKPALGARSTLSRLGKRLGREASSAHTQASSFRGHVGVAFALGMFPRHQGDTSMAQVVLAHCEDERVRICAAEIVREQEREIAARRARLATNGQHGSARWEAVLSEAGWRLKRAAVEPACRCGRPSSDDQPALRRNSTRSDAVGRSAHRRRHDCRRNDRSVSRLARVSPGGGKMPRRQ